MKQATLAEIIQISVVAYRSFQKQFSIGFYANYLSLSLCVSHSFYSASWIIHCNIHICLPSKNVYVFSIATAATPTTATIKSIKDGNTQITQIRYQLLCVVETGCQRNKTTTEKIELNYILSCINAMIDVL